MRSKLHQLISLKWISEQIEKGSLIFTATVTVKPEVKLGEYKGLEVEDKEASVTDEDVNDELKTLQEKQAELVVKEEGQVEEGDTVVIDFEGYLDGENLKVDLLKTIHLKSDPKLSFQVSKSSLLVKLLEKILKYK